MGRHDSSVQIKSVHFLNVYNNKIRRVTILTVLYFLCQLVWATNQTVTNQTVKWLCTSLLCYQENKSPKQWVCYKCFFLLFYFFYVLTASALLSNLTTKELHLPSCLWKNKALQYFVFTFKWQVADSFYFSMLKYCITILY